MPPFKIVTDFTPQGDQPQAIKELVQGVQKGLSHQTLLGVTGSGKSLDYNEPVLVYKRVAGSLVPYIFPIGQFVDEVFLSDESSNESWFTLSIDPVNCFYSPKPIQSVSKHKAPKTMWKVATECGRKVVLTGDHNLWVLRNGHLKLIKTADINDTDYLSVPLDMPAPSYQFAQLDLVDFFRRNDSHAYIQSNSLIKKLIKRKGRKWLLKELRYWFPRPWEKVHCIEKDKKGAGFRINIFCEFIEKNRSYLKEDDLQDVLIHCGGRNRLPSFLEMSHEVLKIFGWYIAEGHATERYITISIRHNTLKRNALKFIKKINISCSLRQDGDIQISHKLLTSMFSILMGSHARNKRLPFFWPRLSNEQLGSLISAYFDGDGGVESGGLVCATASQQLANDLLYALLRFGVWARVQKRFKKATNTNHPGSYYYYVTVSGYDNIKKFSEHVFLDLKYKVSGLNKLLKKTPHSNVDVIPVNPLDLKKLRKKANIFATKIADLTHSSISMLESGKRHPSRVTLKKLINTYGKEIKKSKDNEAHVLLEKMAGFLHVRWTKVKQAKKMPYKKLYVYDLSVPGSETFFAGFGGLFVHNTFTMAHVIEQVQKPTLIMAPNKTLAAQLYGEMKELFPHNAVEYFVSYYDYYQPEAYVPTRDLFIEKDSSINEEIDKLRHSATHALLERQDVIIVASVSCIYGLGSPEAYQKMLVFLQKGCEYSRNEMLNDLIKIQYERSDYDFHRGTFRVRGDVVEIFPAYEEARAIRVSFFGDEIEELWEVDPLTGRKLRSITKAPIYPASHYVAEEAQLKRAIGDIRVELKDRIQHFHENNQPVEEHRITQRTNYDLEMMEEIGFCKGIENYSRHITGRKPGEAPPTLIEYFSKDHLLFIDESHIGVSQIRGMYRGDRARKMNLVEYGFRLPSALDNRPLMFEEFEKLVKQTVYVSATPADYEIEKSKGAIVEQVIRPTGLIDPEITVRPATTQVDDLLEEIRKRVEKHERVLVTTLTKKMSEDLTTFYQEVGIKVRYLHSDIETLERVEILRQLREGVFDVLVGINLLREGLDLPEVSLVAILDADKEGFLRSTRSLIQTFGRAARNVNGRVILYADKMTGSMREAIQETERRRDLQLAYNKKHKITPTTIVKSMSSALQELCDMDYFTVAKHKETRAKQVPPAEVPAVITSLRAEMKKAAAALDFERAAEIRDQIQELQTQVLAIGFK